MSAYNVMLGIMVQGREVVKLQGNINLQNLCWGVFQILKAEKLVPFLATVIKLLPELVKEIQWVYL